MCDYSLQSVKSRAANVDDKLVVRRFLSGSKGFVSVADGTCDLDAVVTAVCVMPGTELAFDENISVGNLYDMDNQVTEYKVARFRQVDVSVANTHHDAMELPDGTVYRLQMLTPGQRVTVLQLPAAPKTEAEAKEQKRIDVVA